MTLPIAVRRSVAIVAVLALSLLLLRSACDVLALPLPGAQPHALSALHDEPGAGSGSGETLHASLHATSLAGLASAPDGKPLAAAPMTAALAVPALLFLSLVAARAAPIPPRRSYYARSARVLR